jgi:hypothetical protein
MWPRSVFERVGLFDEELVRNQDDEFSYRIRKAGGRIVVTPAMRSAYQNRQSWRKLTRQFYEYGVWKVRILQKHPNQMSLRHFVPPAFDAALIVALLCAPAWPPLFLAVGGVLMIYAGVMACVSLGSGGSAAGRARTLLALAIIHHAWACGFLVGTVRFAPRWLRSEPEPRSLGAI